MSDDAQIDAWLQPLDGAPCGEDLEYDLQFLEFAQAAAGKPETQFSAAEPPAWSEVIQLAEALFARTRDLRVAVPWARAQLNTGGLVELPGALRLLLGLLDNYWDTLHPGLDPDDGDPFARISPMNTLAEVDGLLGDARQVPLLQDRRLGGLRGRDIELLLDRLPARPDDPGYSSTHIQGMLGDAPEATERIRASVATSLELLTSLQRLMNDRFGIERSIDVKPLRLLLQAVAEILPAPGAAPGESAGGTQDESGAGDDGSAPAPGPRGNGRRGNGPMSIESRADAVKAIQLICAYLERAEPTNPAQLLLRRAERVIDRNFMQLVNELAPDALREVSRIMGIDPDSISMND